MQEVIFNKQSEVVKASSPRDNIETGELISIKPSSRQIQRFTYAKVDKLLNCQI